MSRLMVYAADVAGSAKIASYAPCPQSLGSLMRTCRVALEHFRQRSAWRSLCCQSVLASRDVDEQLADSANQWQRALEVESIDHVEVRHSTEAAISMEDALFSKIKPGIQALLRLSKQSVGTSAWLFLAAGAALGCFESLQFGWLLAWDCCPSRIPLLKKLWAAPLPSADCLPFERPAAFFLLPLVWAFTVSPAGAVLSVSCCRDSGWEAFECPSAGCTGALGIGGRPGPDG